MLKHFPLNELGNDYVCGDIHGCFTKLQTKLDEIGFDGAKDRLFSVGDLVDRGYESEESIDWIAKPWFHAVRGNHEQMAIDAYSGMFDVNCYTSNGGEWFLQLPKTHQKLFVDAFLNLPIAADVQTKDGLVGIVHSDCPVRSWQDFEIALTGENAEVFAQMCMWSRERVQCGDTSEVAGVSKVMVGHTPMKQPRWFGNVQYIDTGAVFGHELTIIKIH